jgi:glutamate-1-semialdehyde 2,1-aminomutase
LGHAAPAVVAAVQETAARGLTFGAATEAEATLARLVCDAMPSVEMVRFVNSGTEATMSAIRVARAFTGRSKIVKFDGCYHGHADGLLVQAGSGVATLALPDSAGVPENYAAETLVAPYNDLAALTAIFERYGAEIAAVIVEPVAANMGVVPPLDGFLEGVRTLCDDNASLLIFDEVITGFRVGRGGAQARFGIRPDLSCFGKVIGGGLPVGAYGGRRDVMSCVAPLGPVYQAGTLSGNPLATAAGLAALDLLDDAAYVALEGIAARLADGLTKALASAGITGQVPVEGTLVGLFFGPQLPTDYAGARTTDEDAYARFFHALLDEGVAIAPGAYEILFPGLAHDGPVLDEIVSAAWRAAATMG